MTGTVVFLSAKHRQSGEIRPDDGTQRLPFDGREVINARFDELLGRAVAFDVLDNKAVRVRPITQPEGSLNGR